MVTSGPRRLTVERGPEPTSAAAAGPTAGAAAGPTAGAAAGPTAGAAAGPTAGAPTDGWSAAARLGAIFVVAGAVFAWRIGRPSPWIDEAATWHAVHRSWGRLLAMLRGSDAPLVPYYVLAKVWAVVDGEVAGVRLLSAVAAAAAVSCLALLLARWSGWRTAFTGAALLIGLAGFDRFAQEARPYALLALLTCASWLAWDHWRCSRSVRAGVMFGLLTAALAVTHLFGLLVLPAQVLADRSEPADDVRCDAQTILDRWWPGWRAARGTACWGLLGVLAANVQVGVAVVNGAGPSADLRATPSNLWQTEVISLTASKDEPFAVALILALAGLGAAMVARRRWRPAVTPLLWWALLPLGLAAAATVVQPNLLRARYWVFMLPPMAGLAAVGVTVLANLVGRLTQRVPGTGPRIATWVATGVALALVGLHAAVQMPAQQQIRTGAGHGEDAVAAMKLARAAARDGGAVVVFPPQGMLVTSTVDSGAPPVKALFAVDPTQPDVWPVERSPSAVTADLAGVRTLHLLYREPGGALIAGPVHRVAPMDQIRGDPYPVLTHLGFRPVQAVQASPGWILATLTR